MRTSASGGRRSVPAGRRIARPASASWRGSPRRCPGTARRRPPAAPAGSTRPSCKSSREPAGIDPARSRRRRRGARARPRSRPAHRVRAGAHRTSRSGSASPVNGSLRIRRRPDRDRCDHRTATASGIAPRCTGSSDYGHTGCCASQIAVLQSRVRRRSGENALRTSAASISSATARMAIAITCSVMGSIAGLIVRAGCPGSRPRERRSSSRAATHARPSIAITAGPADARTIVCVSMPGASPGARDGDRRRSRSGATGSASP